MAVGRILRLLRGDVERDPGFTQELLPAIAAGLHAVAAVEAAFGAFLAVMLWPYSTYPAVLVLVGGITFGLARIKRLTPYGRWVALVSVWAGAAILSMGPEHDYIALGATVLVLTGAGAVPLPPLRAAALGLGAHLVCAALAPAPASRQVYFGVLTLLAAIVALVRYANRSGRFEAHRRALRENEILSTAQLRAQLSENAVSVARLAAALTHELNSPLGTMKSSVETLVAISGRCLTAGPEEQRRLAEMQRQLQESVQESAARLQSVVARLQRFAEVEQTDLQEALVDELISGAALRLEEEGRKTGELELCFGQAPPVICRPGQLSTVFASLLSNAFESLNGAGRVVVTTAFRDGSVEVAIRDTGRGMDGEELDHIFDPSFRITGSRVSTGNWSLFSARQIVYEHGGDITIDSAPGAGTTVRVTLPA